MKQLVCSIGYALAGLRVLLKTQANARWHLLATGTVLALGFWLQLSASEWVALILAMALVWVAEALNTAIEFLANALHPQQHSLIKKAKDVAASAVLLAAFAALLVGGIVFLGNLWAKFTS